MKEIHISIFYSDNLRLNELHCKLNRYTAKVTADPFEPNMSIENLYVCITIILSLLHLKELNKEEDMICFTLDKQDDGNVTLTAYYPYI